VAGRRESGLGRRQRRPARAEQHDLVTPAHLTGFNPV